MSGELPALTGPELIKLIKTDGWVEDGYRTHGMAMVKQFRNRKRVTTIPTTNESLPKKTLSRILGPQQTNIGRKGLLKLLSK